MVGTGRRAADAHVWHRGIERIAEVRVICAEDIVAALPVRGIEADNFSFDGEDKEGMFQGGCPAIDLLRVRHLCLDLCVNEEFPPITLPIHPGASRSEEHTSELQSRV